MTARRPRRVKLDLGCGLQPRKGFTGVDLYCGPKRVDLFEYPWPWDESSVDEVFCAHFVEHQPRGLWISFVDELWRILKPDAVATIVHPNLKTVRAFQDPTHQDFIPAERWAYANQRWRKENGLDHPPYPTCDFELVAQNWGGVHPEFFERAEAAKVFAISHYWDAAADVMVVLRAKKG